MCFYFHIAGTSFASLVCAVGIWAVIERPNIWKERSKQ